MRNLVIVTLERGGAAAVGANSPGMGASRTFARAGGENATPLQSASCPAQCA